MKKLALIILTLFFVVSTTYATQINFGETLCESIDEPAEVDPYLFSAIANDKVLVRMTKTSGSLTPAIRVNDPDGNPLPCDDWSSTTAEIASCDLPVNGVYTIQAYDYWGTGTGGYCLCLQRLNNPGNVTPISFEQTHADSISTYTEMDTYTFRAIADAVVRVRMTKTSGSLTPAIRVYDPDGTLLCDDWSSTTADIENCDLPSDGIYTILAYDYWGTGTGEYYLFLGCLNPPCGEAEPFLDIDVNGSDGPVFITPDDAIDVSVSLNSGDMSGVKCDWWVGALTPFGTYWVNPSLRWVRSNTPISVGQWPLFDLSETQLLSTQLPVGIYTFFFVLDETPDGVFDLTWFDYCDMICLTGGALTEVPPDLQDVFQ